MRSSPGQIRKYNTRWAGQTGLSVKFCERACFSLAMRVECPNHWLELWPTAAYHRYKFCNRKRPFCVRWVSPKRAEVRTEKFGACCMAAKGPQRKGGIAARREGKLQRESRLHGWDGR